MPDPVERDEEADAEARRWAEQVRRQADADELVDDTDRLHAALEAEHQKLNGP